MKRHPVRTDDLMLKIATLAAEISLATQAQVDDVTRAIQEQIEQIRNSLNG